MCKCYWNSVLQALDRSGASARLVIVCACAASFDARSISRFSSMLAASLSRYISQDTSPTRGGIEETQKPQRSFHLICLLARHFLISPLTLLSYISRTSLRNNAHQLACVPLLSPASGASLPFAYWPLRCEGSASRLCPPPYQRRRQTPLCRRHR